MQAHHAGWSVVASLVVVLLSCTPPAPKVGGGDGGAGGSGEKAGQCPLFERDPMKEPDLMAWDPTQRQKINEKRDQGVVAVHMEQNGCDVTARVVDCVGKVSGAGAQGPYEYKWYYTSDTVYADSQREAYTKLPLGAASLGAEVGAGKSLRVDFVMAGSYVLPDAAQVVEWVGSECERATHLVKRVVVGGFARASGERDAVHGDVGLFVVGGGAGQQRSRLHWRTEGSPKACQEAAEKQSASAGCDMPLRLELAPIAGREQGSGQVEPIRTAAPAAPTPSAAGGTAAAVGSSRCPVGMAWVEGGAFMMGSSSGYDDEQPVHRVELDGFCMDVTEVTVEAYARCVSAGSCTKPDTDEFCNWGQSGKGNHPINCVDWDQATAYCRWAGKELPTEAQWEYAARGGSRQLEYPWGSEAPGSRACWNRWDGTCPVGSYPSGDSPFGLHDMAGNVWEWVQDWYGPYPTFASKNYAGPSSGSLRVYRGGSWFLDDSSSLRGSIRSRRTPDYRNFHLGFRCARTR